MNQGTLELRQHFDPVAWEVAPLARPRSTLLVTWSLDPTPLDAGIPDAVQRALAEALCSLGPCWFAGDDGAEHPIAAVHLRRRLSTRETRIFRADAPAQLNPAFQSGRHDWSMAAQWIVVGASGHATDDRMAPLVKRLLEDWALPADWPAELLAVVQAGVDGDAAACHCRSAGVEQSLRAALEHGARRHGLDVQPIDAT